MLDATIAETRDDLLADLRAVIVDAEALLNATVGETGERIRAARARAEETLNAAKARLAAVGDPMIAQAKFAAKSTDEFVHDHPWGAVGIAAAAGLVLGILISRR